MWVSHAAIEVFRQISIDHVGVAPADVPVHVLDRVGSAPSRAVAIGTVLEVRLEDRPQHQLGGGLNHPVPNGRMPSGRSPPPGLGIITRRTAAGRYVFATRSPRRPASHSSSPSASIRSNVTPSTPGAPPLERASA